MAFTTMMGKSFAFTASDPPVLMSWDSAFGQALPNTAPTVNVPRPSGLVVGDLVVIATFMHSDTTDDYKIDGASPGDGDWSKLGETNAAGVNEWYVYGKIATSTEVAASTFTVGLNAPADVGFFGTGKTNILAWSFRISGASSALDLGDTGYPGFLKRMYPQDSIERSVYYSDTSTCTARSLTTTSANWLCLYGVATGVYYTDPTTVPHSTPSGWTKLEEHETSATASSLNYLYNSASVGWKVQETAGATNNATVTLANTGEFDLTFQVAFKPE